jgi:putative DNA primase/helicase
MDVPEDEWLLFPVIMQKGVSMIAAPRGVGKSFFAMTAAIAVASGIDFLNLKAEKPRKVLYIDGEMSGFTVQKRFRMLIAGFEAEGKVVNQDNLIIYGNDFQGDGTMPDFSKEKDWEKMEKILESQGDIDLIILDNIYTLYTCADENAASNWQLFNRWSVNQRKKGRSVLWIHHTGKDTSKGVRGSSAIETLFNTTLLLTPPPGHDTKDGAVVMARYIKARDLPVGLFCAKLESVDDDGLRWVLVQTPKDETLQEIIDLLDEGKPVPEISEIIGISKSAIYRALGAAGIKNPNKIAKENAARIMAEASHKDIEI